MKTLLKRVGPGPWAISFLLRHLLATNVHKLEYDPVTQYRFHQSFMFFWLICMVVVLFIPAFDQLAPRLIMEVSLYANFTTDFGAMSSALSIPPKNGHCLGCQCPNKNIAAQRLPEPDF